MTKRNHYYKKNINIYCLCAASNAVDVLWCKLFTTSELR